MADVPFRPTGDDRLRDFLAAELRQAELDFPHLRRRQPSGQRRGLPIGLAVAGFAVLALVLVGPRFLDRGPVGAVPPPLGADGLPLSIDGEPVLRGDDVAARRGPGSFLAGGMLVLDTSLCGSRSALAQLGCGAGWGLALGPVGDPSAVWALDGLADAPGFVRTSGAPTVARVHARVSSSGATSNEILVVEGIVWRQATKGPIPENASPPGGGEVNDALVPDFVSAWAEDGVTIAGYVPKGFLFHASGLIPGSLSDPPQAEPVPVYAEDLTTLVGHMVPGAGYVALGSSAIPKVPSASMAASAAPSPTPSSASGVIVACGRISADACAAAINLVRAGHEAEVAGATRIVMDDTCPPTVRSSAGTLVTAICDRMYRFDTIVVFVTAGSDTTGWYAFSVVGLVDDSPTTVKPWVGDIPAAIIRTLTEARPAR
jgi:hypothetical protein